MVERFRAGARMSQAVKAKGLLYTAGQVAADPQPCIEFQTRQVLAQIDALLAEAGARREDMVFASIWLADVRHFDLMNAIWDAWVPPGAPPARATVGAPLAGPQFLVEVAVVAACD